MRAGFRPGTHMSAYTQELTVNWGESDPFGLVYYAREVAWFNEIEHELFRQIGHPINKMITEDRSAFVMGEIQFRFVGPAAYGDRVRCTLTLLEIREKTVHWHCDALNLRNGQQITGAHQARHDLPHRVFERPETPPGGRVEGEQRVVAESVVPCSHQRVAATKLVVEKSER